MVSRIAVGAYSATGLLAADPRELENTFLSALGLTRAPITTQVVPGESWADLAHALLTVLGVLADIAHSCITWSIAMTVRGSRGSPLPLDDVEIQTLGRVTQIWKGVAPRVITAYADQISEHQRDLTNSASQRFLPEMLAWSFIATRLVESVIAAHVNARTKR